jgi:hypothetical protein
LLQFLVCVHRSAEQVHAMKKKNALIRIIYIWLHPVICYVLLIATNALVQLAAAVSEDNNGSVESNDRLRHTVSIGLCIVVLVMVLMRLLHKGVIDHLRTTGRAMHVLFKICVAFTHLSLYWMVQNNLYFILANSFLCTFTNVVEMAIPMFTQSRAVDILFVRTTVDAAKAPGAQKELNANRKSVLALQAERGSSPGGSHSISKSGRNSPSPLTSGLSGHAVELQVQHSARHDASPVIRNALHATPHTAGHTQHDRHSQHPHGSQSSHSQPQESQRSALPVEASEDDGGNKQFAAILPDAEANEANDHEETRDSRSSTKSSPDAEDMA